MAWAHDHTPPRRRRFSESAATSRARPRRLDSRALAAARAQQARQARPGGACPRLPGLVTVTLSLSRSQVGHPGDGDAASSSVLRVRLTVPVVTRSSCQPQVTLIMTWRAAAGHGPGLRVRLGIVTKADSTVGLLNYNDPSPSHRQHRDHARTQTQARTTRTGPRPPLPPPPCRPGGA